MGRNTLTLLLTAMLAIVLGVGGTMLFASMAVTSSADAAKTAQEAVAAGSKELDQPVGYGSR